VLKKIRADEELEMVPVVVLSSSRERKDIAEAYKLGANAYIVKPIDFNEFVEARNHLSAFWAIFNKPPTEV
jgi:DNA-binding response OmpR family regulator